MKSLSLIILFLSSLGFAQTAEVKVMIVESDISKTLKIFALKKSEAKEAQIYFFDSTDFKLKNKGIILRARHKINDPDDVTIKFRPCTQDDLEVEVDYSAKASVESCSLTLKTKKLFPGEIDELLPVSASKLRSIGPIQSYKWKVEGFSFEVWQFKGKEILEVSKKVDLEEASNTLSEIQKLLKSNKIKTSNSQTKTEFAFSN
jgi:uncharacterized protein YjbK